MACSTTPSRSSPTTRPPASSRCPRPWTPALSSSTKTTPRCSTTRRTPTTSATSTITPPAPDETYVEVLALTNLPYFIDHELGLEFAGKELGVKTKFVGPVDYDMTAMVNTLEQTIAEKPAGILVVGFDPALKPSIDKAADAGIPIVTLDAEVYGSKRLTFLGTGNVNAGKVGRQDAGRPDRRQGQGRADHQGRPEQPGRAHRRATRTSLRRRTTPTSRWSRSSTTRATRPRLRTV